jgi:hypothetical protein
MRDAVGGFADPLRTYSAFDLGRLGAAGLAEHSKQNHPMSRRQPICHSGLLAEQVEPQLADLPGEVTGVRLVECLGTLGEQPDKEVDPAKVSVSETFQPGPHFWLDLDLVQIGYAPDGICISRYGQADGHAP